MTFALIHLIPLVFQHLSRTTFTIHHRKTDGKVHAAQAAKILQSKHQHCYIKQNGTRKTDLAAFMKAKYSVQSTNVTLAVEPSSHNVVL